MNQEINQGINQKFNQSSLLKILALRPEKISDVKVRTSQDRILSKELAASAAYNRVRKVLSDFDPTVLDSLRCNHEAAVRFWSQGMSSTSIMLEPNLRAWGRILESVFEHTIPLDVCTLIRALKEGECLNQHSYVNLNNRSSCTQGQKEMVMSTFLPMQAYHISVLDQILKRPKDYFK